MATTGGICKRNEYTREYFSEYPTYKDVVDTRLARAMFPDFILNENGTLKIIDGYREPVRLGQEKGFSYDGTMHVLFTGDIL